MKRLHLIPDRLHIEESLQLVKDYQAAFEYNDFFLADILEDTKKQMEIIDFYAKVRPDFSKDTMHGAFLDVTVHSSDKRIREISELRVRQSMNIAKEMGLYGVVFHTNRIYGFRDTVYLKNWLNVNSSFFQHICEEYPEQFIFMENMFDEAPDILCELAENMKAYTNFGVCLDYGHGVVSDTPIAEWVKQLAPYIRHMHINDNDLKNDLHLPVGAGAIDWKQFMNEIKQYHIDATVLIEVTGIEKQQQSLEYMKKEQILL